MLKSVVAINCVPHDRSVISYPLLDLHHIHGGVRVFRKGESTEQYPHTGASLAPNGINQKIGFVSTEGYPHPEASSTVHVLDW